jgi:diguanylate cyclase (GGDEF)-like protein
MANRSVFRVLLLGLGLLVLMLGYQLRVGYESALSRAHDDAENLAFILDGQIEATFRRIEGSLGNIASQLPDQSLQTSAADAYRERVAQILMPLTENFPELGGFYVWDAEGNNLYGSVPPAMLQKRASIAQRPTFQLLKNDSSVNIAYSDAIRGSVSGLQTVAAYMAVRDSSGKLKAVVTGSLNLAYIEQVFKSLRLGKGSVVFIRRSDNHKLVIRYPARDADINTPVRNPIQERIDAGESEGRDRFRAVTDGEYRIYAFRKLDPFPFYSVVGIAERSALRAWDTNVLYMAGGGTILLLVLGGLLLRMRREERLRLAAQQEVETMHRLMNEAVDNISLGFTIFDASGKLVIYNEAYLDMLGGCRDAVRLGITFRELARHTAERGLYIKAADRIDEWVAERVRMHEKADGQPLEQELSDGRWVLAIEHRTPSGYIVSNRIDITERKRLEAELEALASIDTLTRLPNRRQFMARLAEELQRVQRQMTQSACVLMLDIDHFKQINDTYGHAGGDMALQHFAALMRSELRTIDSCGRLGGEEFAILLPGASLEAAQRIAERLRLKLAESSVEIDGKSVALTASIGIALLHPADVNPDAVLQRADAALYQAKATGRNRVVAEPDMA